MAQVSATEYTSSWTTFANVEKSWAYVQDQLPSTHPIAADMVDLAAVEVNFDGITYAKGASVLKQLAAYVGYEQFLAGLREYFAAHAFGNATLEDLLAALERSLGSRPARLGRRLAADHRAEHHQRRFEVDEQGRFTEFAVLQSRRRARRRRAAAAPAGRRRLRPGRRRRAGAHAPGGAGRRAASAPPCPIWSASTAGALVLVNDDDLTYCKARLDPDSLRTAIDGIADVTESLPRTLLWSAVWEMTRDALMRARDFVTLAVRGMATEDQIGVLQRVLAQLQVAVGSYAEPGWASRNRLAGGVRRR